MALLNIHVFIDDEVIEADDLNSIAEAVSAEIGSGNISSASLVWPLVAQGDIDMNGYSINNIASFFDQYHVNDSYTLESAISAVNAAGGGTIIIDPDSTSTISNETITASNVSIVGSSGSCTITIDGAATPHGLKVTGNYFTLKGCQITGGATGIPCILIDGPTGTRILENTFNACAGPCVKFTGGEGNNEHTLVEENIFAYCDEQGIIALNMVSSTIDCNAFESVDGNNIELAADSGISQEISISNNTFRDGDAPAIYGGRTGVAQTAHGELVIVGNSINTTATYAALDLGIYLNNTITGNAFQDDVQLKIERSTVSANTFNADLDINFSTTAFTGNSVRGDVTRTSGANNVLNSNIFEAALEIDAAWVDVFVGNKATAGVTITTNVPDVVGLNWGY